MYIIPSVKENLQLQICTFSLSRLTVAIRGFDVTVLHKNENFI